MYVTLRTLFIATVGYVTAVVGYVTRSRYGTLLPLFYPTFVAGECVTLIVTLCRTRERYLCGDLVLEFTLPLFVERSYHLLLPVTVTVTFEHVVTFDCPDLERNVYYVVTLYLPVCCCCEFVCYVARLLLLLLHCIVALHSCSALFITDFVHHVPCCLFYMV